MFSYRSVPPRPSSLCTFFVCDPYVAPRSLISNPIANGIIDWPRHTEKRSYAQIWFPFSRIFTPFPKVHAIMQQ